MFSKKKILIMAGGALAAVIGTVMTGCGDKPVASTDDTYGLKAVSIGSSELFNGDITKLPGYDVRQQMQDRLATGKAARTDALIDFDAAYAVVVYCLASNYVIDMPTMCEENTDLFNAFGGFSDKTSWNNIQAGLQALQLKEIVSITELDKNGDHVEGTIYVKPGYNDVAVIYVKKDSVFWYSGNHYLNLDGWDVEFPAGYESGWQNPAWGNGSLYPWEFPHIGNLEVTAVDVEDYCTNDPPVFNTYRAPNDSAVGVSASGVYFTASATDPDYDPLTYTLRCDENMNPSAVLYTGDYISDNFMFASNTRYYWNVRVTDGENTVTSPTYTFFTNLDFTTGTLTDARDGSTYVTVTIKGQEWMAENLNYGTPILGANEQTDNATPEKFDYDDDPTNALTYGGLYQWDEVMEYSTAEGVQGLCPFGWHIPTDAEWQTLEQNVGMFQDAAADTGWRGLKEGAGAALWNYNSSGFNAQFAGQRNDLTGFSDLGVEASFWTSTEVSGTSEAYIRLVESGNNAVRRIPYGKNRGFCVRCIRDN